jgi:ssDNA-binding Zn-finger/Zn-ribbon topoisomerase 1
VIHIENVNVWFYQKDGKLNVEVRCPKCQSKPEAAKGGQGNDRLVYMLNCPTCRTTLIEYSSPEELSGELSQIVAKWRV